MSLSRLVHNFRQGTLMILIALPVLGFSVAHLLLTQPSIEFREGYAQGYREAELEIKTQKLTRYTAGLPRFPFASDAATERPLKFVGGCVVDEFCKGRIQGHENRILAHLAEAQPSALGLKNWTDDLNDLILAYARQANEHQPVRSPADGLSPRAPADGFHLRLHPSEESHPCCEAAVTQPPRQIHRRNDPTLS